MAVHLVQAFSLLSLFTTRNDAAVSDMEGYCDNVYIGWGDWWWAHICIMDTTTYAYDCTNLTYSRNAIGMYDFVTFDAIFV